MTVAFTAPVRTTTGRASILAVLGRTPWAVVDQMVISATNFVTIILLARGFSPASLGSFTLVYSALLFVNSLQAGLVTQPHNILGATRRGEDYARYTSATALSQLLLALAGAILSLAAFTVAWLVGWDGATLLLALAPAIVGWQLQEFARRVLYTEGRVKAALGNDLISYGGQAIAIAAMRWMDCLSGPLALWAIATTSALGAFLGAWQIRSALIWQIDKLAFRENWHFGKWVAGGEIFGHWLSVQLFIYLAAAVLGTAAAGVLRAVHTVFGPSRVLADVFCTMLPIRFARTLADGGKAALHAQLKLAYLLAVPLLGGYCLLVAVCARPILWVLYGDKYTGSSAVLALFAVSAFASYMTMIVAAALRATRLTRQVFMSQTYASLVAFPIGWLMVLAFGIQGTVLGMTATYLALGILLWQTYRREQTADRNSQAPSHDKAPAAAVPQWLSESLPPGDHQIAGPGLIMMRIFQVLDEANVPYCVIHGYRDYPHSIHSDVDCVMPKEVLPGPLAALLHQNRGRIGAQMVQWIHEDTHYIVLAGRNPDGSLCFLRLDVSADCEFANRIFYSGKDVLETRRRHNGFWIPAPDIEFGWTLARRTLKGILHQEHEQILESLYKQAPAACREQVVRLWGDSNASQIVATISTENWDEVRRNLGHLRHRLLWRTTVRHPLKVAKNWWLRLARRIRRWSFPTHGVSVVLLGPDGAGKSSVARGVRQDLMPVFFETVCRSFPPAILHRGSGTDTTPHAARPRSWLSSVVRAVLYWYVYHTLGYCFTTRKDLARCSLVLHDRHLVDSMVDPRRYRYSGPPLLLRLICRLIPQPDLVIVLDAPAEVMQARKQEVDFEETARQRDAYWQLASQMSNGRTVDASQPLGRVIADVDRLIVRYLADRTAKQLGLATGGQNHPAVLRVLEQFIGCEDEGSWIVDRLGRGDQADVFIARTRDGHPIWQGHAEVVVKLYRTERPAVRRTAHHEVESLRQLVATVKGRRFHGWSIHCPLPLYVCQRPFALVMTYVPGRPLNRCLDADVVVEELHSAGEAVVDAMERYWSAGGEIYGDLDLNNILCDFSGRNLSFVDPGIPESTYRCGSTPKSWYPASRDLAYMLFDVAASIRASMGNPRIRQRQKHFVEASLRAFLKRIDSKIEAQRFLDEIHLCTGVHVKRINVSWSPIGLFRLIVRQTASRCVDDMLRRLKVGAVDRES
ncbi:MAG: hypothetical protein ACM359_19020 [Bacillota bacterium]